MKHLIHFLLSFFMVCSVVTVPVMAQVQYEIVDYREDQVSVIASFKTLKSASSYYEEHRYEDEFSNLGIRKGETLLTVDKGIVFFSSDGCKVNTEYRDVLSGNDGYTNGCYGADGLLVGSNLNKGTLVFMMAGVQGRVKRSEVGLVPLSQAGRITSYTVRNGRLYHQIRQSRNSDRYSTMIDLGPSFEPLQEGEVYYSADGHYFYEQPEVMIGDLQEDRHSNALNRDDPFYFYYQYLSHRSLSSYSQDDLEYYFNDILGIDRTVTSYKDRDRNSVHDTLNQSLYFDELDSFTEAQSLYGANALMMLALSMNESAYGRSSLCYTRNNLFGHAAYDSDVEANAKRYFKVKSSVYSHASKYISGSYLNPDKFQFHGGFFGDKASGMNVSYASDPYWGEKASSYYMQLDEALGFKDRNTMTIGIHQSNTSMKVYRDKDETSEVLYETGRTAPMAMILLEKEGDWFKVQSEKAQNGDFTYRYDQDTGYVKASEFDVILNPEQLETANMTVQLFDSGMGIFPNGQTQVKICSLKGTEPSAPEPQRSAFLFDHWDKKKDHYEAVYRQIDSIEMKSLPTQQLDLNSRIDLEGGEVTIRFTDGEKETVPLTSSMVSGFDMKTEGDQQVIVSIAEVTTSYPITVSDEMNQKREEFRQLMKETDPDPVRIKELLDTMSWPSLTMDEIRELDQLLIPLLENQRTLVIDSEEPTLSVSGLSMAVKQKDPGKKQWIRDTVKLSMKYDGLQRKNRKKAQQVAEGNHVRIESQFRLKVKKNLFKSELNGPLVISMACPEGHELNEKLNVWRIEEGNVIQCPTIQSESGLTFSSEKDGDFVIVSRKTGNTYGGERVEEVIHVTDSALDLPDLIIRILTALAVLILATLLALVLQRSSNKRKRRRRKQTGRIK